jgi:hypothetical protein
MKIILDEKEVTTFVPDSLPMLIHGKEGSGASLYTLAVASKWFQLGYEVLFLCGYPMAEEEFNKIRLGSDGKITFFTKGQVEAFVKAYGSREADNRIIFIKNVELFRQDLLDLVYANNKLVISGDINESQSKDKILGMNFTTQVYFSPFSGIKLPNLNKYEGYVTSGDYTGLTRLEK